MDGLARPIREVCHLATAASIATINGLKLVQVYMLFGLRAHNLKYLKGILAIGGGALIDTCSTAGYLTSVTAPLREGR
jgi:glycerol dehydrogenase-like iron-containing ADH family enzyme